MLYNFLPIYFQNFLVFKAFIALLLGFLLCFVLGKVYISTVLAKKSAIQPIRGEGPKDHLVSKKNTPTMGGVFVVVAIVLTSLLFCDLGNNYFILTLASLIMHAIIGFIDDYKKIVKKNNRGISSKLKFFLQVTLASVIVYFFNEIAVPEYINHTIIPFKQLFFDNAMIDFSWFFVLFAIIVIVGSSNAVNLTDGLDGLVSVPVICSVLSFALIFYLIPSHANDFNGYISTSFELQELVIFCFIIVGCILGFLWWNSNPADVFMGDVGSLALGGLVGTFAVISHSEFFLLIFGLVFVIEAMSVIMQVVCFKVTRGKRLFLMSPIHHHFEYRGVKEQKIVIRFWIASILLAIIGSLAFILHIKLM